MTMFSDYLGMLMICLSVVYNYNLFCLSADVSLQCKIFISCFHWKSLVDIISKCCIADNCVTDSSSEEEDNLPVDIADTKLVLDLTI